MPGMGAIFTQPRGGTVCVPHPHCMCITEPRGLKGYRPAWRESYPRHTALPVTVVKEAAEKVLPHFIFRNELIRDAPETWHAGLTQQSRFVWFTLSHGPLVKFSRKHGLYYRLRLASQLCHRSVASKVKWNEVFDLFGNSTFSCGHVWAESRTQTSHFAGGNRGWNAIRRFHK